MPSRPLVRRIGPALLALLAVVLVVAAIRAVPDTAPDSDFAVIDLRVLNVIRYLDPVGPYSRYGWSHPGPAYFAVLAPLYVLTGYRHLAILVTVTSLNVGCLAALIAVIRRGSRGHGLYLAAGAMFGLYLYRTWGLLASPWNAHVPIVPLALLVACSAAVVSGRVWFLPAVVGLASFIIQTHVGLALCATTITGAAVTAVVIRQVWLSSGTPRTPIARPLVAGVIVGAALWLLPVADCLMPSGQSNLVRLYQFFTESTPVASHTTGRVFEHYIVAPFLVDLTLPWGAVLPPLNEPTMRSTMHLQSAMIALAALVWWRRRRWFELGWVVVSAVASLTAFISVQRLPEQPLDHTVYWVSVLGILNWSIALAVPIDWVVDRVTTRSLHTAAWLPRIAATAMTIAFAIMGTAQATTRRHDDVHASPRIERLSQIVRAHLDTVGDRAPLVEITQNMWSVDAGVVLQLARTGLRPTVTADWTDMFGRPLLPTGRERVTIRLAESAEHTGDLRFRRDYQLLGDVDQVYVYAMTPPPATDIAPDVRLVDSSNLIEERKHLLVDHRPTPDVGDITSSEVVPFTTVDSFATVEIPGARTMGVRLYGQAGSVFQLVCRGDDAVWRRMGQVRLGSTTGTAVGETYPIDLDTCRELRISPALDAANWWLSEIQLLMARQ